MYYFKSPNVDSSLHHSDASKYAINKSDVPPTVSEMVIEAQKTGQFSRSTQRPTLPGDAHMDFDMCRVSDKIEAALMTERVNNYIADVEAKSKAAEPAKSKAAEPAE